MFTGPPAELRRLETLAAQYAAEVAETLNKIDVLGIGTTQAAFSKIAGPAFVIRQVNGRWTVWSN